MNPSMIADLKAGHQQFFRNHKNQSIKIRIEHLKKLRTVLNEREHVIFEALHQDLKKHPTQVSC